MLEIELVYIPTQKKMIHLHLKLPPGATVADVIALSGLQETNPEIEDLTVGIFAKAVSLDTLVKTGDRVEIYRPLLIDPKEKRRQRALAG